ncbi:MAG: PQQ-binding-like beta-propeller repeat protein, partial [Propionibacteriaceae bacterium]|nr:PQQ-binding-like beta-propeller repeat protein [Propionibacteriaceae bacterium]
GAKAEVEMSIVAVSGVPTLSTVIMTPGRLDIPSDITSGLNWTSEGNARIWDATAEVFTESRYLANLRAQTPGDESAASRGCLDITREQLTGEVFDIVLQTWCPGVGIVRSSEATGDWALTTSVPPTKVDSETPFDWNLVERFEFSPRLGAEPSVPGSFSVLPISAPGLVPGGIIIADRFNTEIYGLTIDTEIPQTAWTTRPGGSLTAAATLGGITLVATTNRQIVAYNKEGRWLWQTQLNDLTVAPPVRFGELAILTSLDGSVTALELRSGDIAWNLDIGAEIRSQAVVTTDRILVSNQAGALACIDAKGELLWLQDVGALQSLAVSGGDDPIVVVGKQGSVVLDAYLLETGEQLWRQRAYQNPRELISLTDVLVLRDDDWVLGIDWTTGAVLWGWNQQRTTNGIGAGERVLLLGKNGIVLLSAQGEQLRTWPLTPGEGFSGTTYLVAAGEAVLAYNASGFVIGEPR